jgi:predicted PurR-regulated permease PerM
MNNDNMDIIKEQQRIDRQVFGKTNLNDDGTIKMSTSDVVDELQEINAGVGELTTLVVDIKEKLEDTKDTADDSISEKLEELEQEISKQTLYLEKLQNAIYGRVTVFLFVIIVVLILILIKLH